MDNLPRNCQQSSINSPSIWNKLLPSSWSSPSKPTMNIDNIGPVDSVPPAAEAPPTPASPSLSEEFSSNSPAIRLSPSLRVRGLQMKKSYSDSPLKHTDSLIDTTMDEDPFYSSPVEGEVVEQKNNDIFKEFKLELEDDTFTDAKEMSEKSEKSSPAKTKSISSSSEYTSPIASPPNTKQPSQSYDDLREFDPLVPKDWMMSFNDNGNNMMSFDSPVNQQRNNSNTPSVKTNNNQSTSLLDSLDPLSTPKSLVRFSERDVEEMKKQWSVKYEKEFELIQLELQETQHLLSTTKEEKQQMEGTLSIWENTMNRMISEREKDKDDHKREIEFLKKEIEKLGGEKDKVKKEFELVVGKFKQTRLDNEDLKESEATLKDRVEVLENQLNISEKRYEALKKHAEEKLESANIEIHRVRSTFEKELSSTKIKLSRSEVKVQTLEQTLVMKGKENEELARICDDLVAQIENTT